jgi:hypothetical protein
MSFFFLYKAQTPSSEPSLTLTENPLLVFVAPAANMIARMPEAVMTASADAGKWIVSAS